MEALESLLLQLLSGPVLWLALLALCGAYLQGGATKLADWPGALAEMRQFGLTPAPLFAGLTIAVELLAPLLILTGVFRWLGALALAGFTLLASFRANRFWTTTDAARRGSASAFFEHLGLAGALVLVAWFDLQENPDG